MRNYLLGFLALILVAVGFAALTSHMHPGNASLTPAEQAAADAQKQIDQANAEKAQAKAAANLKTFDQVKGGAVHATLVVAKRGTIQLELYPQAAPKTVAHFTDLAKKHFYDGILFHRVVENFVAQAGDPASKNVDGATIAEPGVETHLGNGGSGTTVPLEATLPHEKYSIGLARTSDPNTGDSQFYINLAKNSKLDGEYCVFGRITSGQDVADKIKQGDRITSLTVSQR